MESERDERPTPGPGPGQPAGDGPVERLGPGRADGPIPGGHRGGHSADRVAGESAHQGGPVAARAEVTKTPVGVEPTSAGLQPAASPSGSGVKQCPRQESNLAYDLRRVA